MPIQKRNFLRRWRFRYFRIAQEKFSWRIQEKIRSKKGSDSRSWKLKKSIETIKEKVNVILISYRRKKFKSNCSTSINISISITIKRNAETRITNRIKSAKLTKTTSNKTIKSSFNSRSIKKHKSVKTNWNDKKRTRTRLKRRRG